MSFDATITLAGDSSSTRDYAAVTYGDRKIIRRSTVTGLGQPQDLTISHSEQKAGTATYDRHLVRFDRTIVDSEGNSATGSVYVVLVAPRGIVTAAQMADQVTQMKNFFTSGNVTKLLNSEP